MRKYLIRASVNVAEAYPTEFLLIIEVDKDNTVVEVVEERVRNLVNNPKKMVHITDILEIGD